MNVEKYHASVRAIHWVMFALFGLVFVLGAVMTEFKAAKPWQMYAIHKSTGVLVFLLVWVRLWTRRRTRTPDIDIPPRIHLAAKTVVYLLYICMIIVPVSGYALSNLHGYEVKLYGLPLPSLFPAGVDWETLSTALHYYFAYAFLGLIILHISAAVLHHIRGQEVLRRIT
ncbi:MAG: cytochrome b [Gammaproteobacteria bacterium]|nr:cytochrome b [Gammaproteobacteria bacterium]